MNNKPVAWIDPFDLERLPIYDCWVSGEKTKYVDIPLYTLKELTDEEIVNLYKETEADNGGIREFARAILRKAQEKC
jgi:hypothetical protein